MALLPLGRMARPQWESCTTWQSHGSAVSAKLTKKSRSGQQEGETPNATCRPMARDKNVGGAQSVSNVANRCNFPATSERVKNARHLRVSRNGAIRGVRMRRFSLSSHLCLEKSRHSGGVMGHASVTGKRSETEQRQQGVTAERALAADPAQSSLQAKAVDQEARRSYGADANLSVGLVVSSSVSPCLSQIPPRDPRGCIASGSPRRSAEYLREESRPQCPWDGRLRGTTEERRASEKRAARSEASRVTDRSHSRPREDILLRDIETEGNDGGDLARGNFTAEVFSCPLSMALEVTSTEGEGRKSGSFVAGGNCEPESQETSGRKKVAEFVERRERKKRGCSKGGVIRSQLGCIAMSSESRESHGSQPVETVKEKRKLAGDGRLLSEKKRECVKGISYKALSDVTKKPLGSPSCRLKSKVSSKATGGTAGRKSVHRRHKTYAKSPAGVLTVLRSERRLLVRKAKVGRRQVDVSCGRDNVLAQDTSDAETTDSQGVTTTNLGDKQSCSVKKVKCCASLLSGDDHFPVNSDDSTAGGLTPRSGSPLRKGKDVLRTKRGCTIAGTSRAVKGRVQVRNKACSDTAAPVDRVTYDGGSCPSGAGCNEDAGVGNRRQKSASSMDVFLSCGDDRRDTDVVEVMNRTEDGVRRGPGFLTCLKQSRSVPQQRLKGPGSFRRSVSGSSLPGWKANDSFVYFPEVRKGGRPRKVSLSPSIGYRVAPGTTLLPAVRDDADEFSSIVSSGVSANVSDEKGAGENSTRSRETDCKHAAKSPLLSEGNAKGVSPRENVCCRSSTFPSGSEALTYGDSCPSSGREGIRCSSDQGKSHSALSSSEVCLHDERACTSHSVQDSPENRETPFSGSADSRTGLKRPTNHISRGNAVEVPTVQPHCSESGNLCRTQLTPVASGTGLHKVREEVEESRGERHSVSGKQEHVRLTLSVRRSPRLSAGRVLATASEELPCGGLPALTDVQLGGSSVKQVRTPSANRIRVHQTAPGKGGEDAEGPSNRATLPSSEIESLPSASALLSGGGSSSGEVLLAKDSLPSAAVSSVSMTSGSSQCETTPEPASPLQLPSRGSTPSVQVPWTVKRCIPYIRSLARRAGWERVPPSLLLLLVKDLGNAIAASGVRTHGTFGEVTEVSGGQTSATAEGKKKKRRLAEVERLLQVQNEWARARTVSLWKKARRGLGDGESLKDVLNRLRGKPSILAAAGAVSVNAL
ncbi:hypothetical protein CSUI_000955 [Cystoisospora suis]|uniref:Uncharacterized protein n=1 Tax=Cystoisospora suis TaxID=483139 RepID=A0A2C6LAH2_9APIC|nr:hypothetical protein CSUI_000955 [Cystoisospora suis]